MLYTGYFSDGLRWGLGNVAPIKISRNSFITSDHWIHISISKESNVLINGELFNPDMVIIKENSNTYRDRDGYIVKEYPSKFQIVVKSVEVIDDKVKADIELSSIPDTEDDEDDYTLPEGYRWV